MAGIDATMYNLYKDTLNEIWTGNNLGKFISQVVNNGRIQYKMKMSFKSTNSTQSSLRSDMEFTDIITECKDRILKLSDKLNAYNSDASGTKSNPGAKEVIEVAALFVHIRILMLCFIVLQKEYIMFTLEAVKKTQSTQVEVLKSEIAKLQKEYLDLQSSKTSCNASNKERVDKLESRIQALQQELDNTKTDRNSTKRNVQQRNATITDLKGKIAALEKERDDILSNKTNCNAANKKRIGELEVNLANLNKQLNTAIQERNVAKQNASAKGSTILELESKKAELEQQIQTAEEEKRTLLEQLRKLREEKNCGNADNKCNIEGLSKQIQELQTKLAATERSLVEEKGNYTALNVAKNKLEAEILAITTDRNAKNADIKQKAQRISELESELQQVKDELTAARSKCNQQEGNVTEFQQQIQSLTSEL
jgi:chromosome segregation ATPase